MSRQRGFLANELVVLHCSETAKDVSAKFIVEAANHPTDPVADEVPYRFLHPCSTDEDVFLVQMSNSWIVYCTDLGEKGSDYFA